MVRRNDDVPAPLKQAANKPPYPISPSTPTAPALPSAPQETGIIRRETGMTENNDDSDSDEWDADSPVEVSKPVSSNSTEIPEPLRIGHPSPSNRKDEELDGWLPESLRAGPAEGRPRIEATLTSPGGTTSQQFEIPHPADLGVRSREGSWSEVTRPSKESITLQSHNPYLRMQQTGQSTFATENSSSSVWAGNTPASPVELPSSPVLVEQTAKLTIDNPWKDTSESSTPEPSASAKQPPLVPEDLEVFPPPSGPPPGKQPAVPVVPTEATTNPFAEDNVPPPLPPRRSQEEEHPSAQPPRPTAAPSHSGAKSIEDQRKEHYQIKHIHWYDDRNKRLRPAPILIQNLNGPCPLLALVNALVLSTPLGQETALIETLRTREQVSLGLLLDAVFDELMSGRRGDSAQALPDVSDLYAFLVTLHTGMNVNPKFMDGTSTTNSGTPGVFEQTRELKLYSTFNIPLIHGWIPGSDDSTAHGAFQRTAKTYDDAINIQFREEELEAKLHSSGLNPEEQQLLQDIGFIKDFLRRWPTQLTTYGLRVMAQFLKPGQFAILFRNDHFSTLYRDPKTGGIFTLVTDAGYSSHDEIIWESLVDVNGQGNELFSGDFRPVGHNAPSGSQSRPSMLDVGDDQQGGWETVSNRRNKNARGGNNAGAASVGRDALFDPQGSASVVGAGHQTNMEASSAALSKEEQEDHDLALALQLQEEEEEQQRRQQAQRREREDEAFAQQQAQGHQDAPLVPPRRTSNNVGSNVNRPNRQSSGEEVLPTYEQAASSGRFNPPRDHPASPLAPVLQNSPGRQRPQSAYAQTAGGGPAQGRRRSSRPNPLINQIPEGSGMGRGRGSGVAGGQYGGDKEKCIVM